VLRELKAVYRSVSEGIINLMDKFFEMERAEALRGLDIIKVRAGSCFIVLLFGRSLPRRF